MHMDSGHERIGPAETGVTPSPAAATADPPAEREGFFGRDWQEVFFSCQCKKPGSRAL